MQSFSSLVKLSTIAILTMVCTFAVATVSLDSRTLYFDDFSEYTVGEGPGGNWAHDNNPVTKAFVRVRDDESNALTMTNLDDLAVARAILTFDTPSEDTVVIEFEWNRLTGRAYENHAGQGLESVPDIRLLAGASGVNAGTPVFYLQFRSWDRTRWLYRNPEGEESAAVTTGSGDFLFDVPLTIRLYYTRSTGEVRFQVSRDGFETVAYDEVRNAMPDLDVNGLGIQSANRTNAEVIYADPVWDIGYVHVQAIGEVMIGGYEDWASFFLSEFPDESGPGDDAGGVGVANFTRYAFALDPLKPSLAKLPGLVEPVSGEVIAFRYHRYAEVEDVIYTVESTGDLSGDWAAHPEEELVVETIAMAGGLEEVTVGVLDTGADRHFFRVRAEAPANLVFDDFSTYESGAVPGGTWILNDTSDGSAFVRERPDGSKALTMTNLDPEGVAVAVLPFTPAASDTVEVEFEWNRLTARAYENHLGEGLGGVPDIRLVADATETSLGTPVFYLQFQSWDRVRWLYITPEGGTSPGVVTASSDFLFDVPLTIRIHYTRSSGEIRFQVSRDGFVTVAYNEVRNAMPNLDVNAFVVQSANRTSEDVIYAEPVWDINHVRVSSR